MKLPPFFKRRCSIRSTSESTMNDSSSSLSMEDLAMDVECNARSSSLKSMDDLETCDQKQYRRAIRRRSSIGATVSSAGLIAVSLIASNSSASAFSTSSNGMNDSFRDSRRARRRSSMDSIGHKRALFFHNEENKAAEATLSRQQRPQRRHSITSLSAFTLTDVQDITDAVASTTNLFEETSIADAPSLLSMSIEGKKSLFDIFTNEATKVSSSVATEAVANPNVQAEILSDTSFIVVDVPKFLPDKFFKVSKLQMKYLELAGRLMVIGAGFLPQHQFHQEELAIQIFLLGNNIKPIIRSIKLLKCISESRCKSTEECSVELDNSKIPDST